MSRIGKLPIGIPSGVEVKITGNTITITGKKGELSYTWDEQYVTLAQEGDEIVVTRKNDEKQSKAHHGLTRSLIANMVTGVTDGFEKRLEILGVGYKADANGKGVKLSLGFSHPVELTAPEGVSIENDKETKHLVISGYDKQKVGQFAAEIRALRKPEPYKGKGVRYVGEYVRRKAGKTAGK